LTAQRVVTQDWTGSYPSELRPEQRPAPCREYRQTLSKLLNSLIELGFSLVRLSDTMDLNADISAEPGSWDHRNAIAPAWLSVWVRATIVGTDRILAGKKWSGRLQTLFWILTLGLVCSASPGGGADCGGWTGEVRDRVAARRGHRRNGTRRMNLRRR